MSFPKKASQLTFSNFQGSEKVASLTPVSWITALGSAWNSQVWGWPQGQYHPRWMRSVLFWRLFLEI